MNYKKRDEKMNQKNNPSFTLQAKQKNFVQVIDNTMKNPQIGNKKINEIYTCSNELKMEILDYLPAPLQKIVLSIDSIVQAKEDVIAGNMMSILASLSKGTFILDSQDDTEGLPLIIYTGFFTKSGGGKTTVLRKLKRYLLSWQEAIYAQKQKDQDKRKAMLEAKIKSLSKSQKDREQKALLEKELISLSQPQPDVYLEDATQEGLEQSILSGSSPMFFLDNFGKFLVSSEKNDAKASFRRMLDNIYDHGEATSRRTKGDNNRAKEIKVNNFGLHLASTLGDSNLRSKDIMDNIEDGFFNKVIICFQDTIDKPIPLVSNLSTEQKSWIEDFAKSYNECAKSNLFYMGNEAWKIYSSFLTQTSDDFIDMYNNDKHLAGYMIRQLNLSKRLACIFQISEECLHTTFSGELEPLSFENRQKLEISGENMERAINFLQFMQREHLTKLMLFAQNSTGILQPQDIVLSKALSLIAKGEKLDPRKIHQNMSKGQKQKVNNIELIKEYLCQLVADKKLENIDAETLEKIGYFKDRPF